MNLAFCLLAGLIADDPQEMGKLADKDDFVSTLTELLDDQTDEDIYDFVLTTFVRAKAKEISFGSHEAHKPYKMVNAGPFAPAQWVQKAGTVIRIDVKSDSFDVWVDGNKLGNIPRDVRGKPITHVRYWIPAGKKPVLGNDLEVTMYQSTSLVQ